MSRRPTRRSSLIVPLILLLTGAALVIWGAVKLWSDGRGVKVSSPAASPAATETIAPLPTATEPIVPPPPTQAQTRARPSATPSRVPSTKAPPSPTPEESLTQQESTTSPSTSSPVPTALSTPSVAAPTPATQEASEPEAAPSPAASEDGLYTLRQRLGVCGWEGGVSGDLAERLGFGWYLNWRTEPGGYRSADVEYVPMIRLKGNEPYPSGEALLAAVDALPGSLWLIGNEPDVRWQDNVPAQYYARLYHDLYVLLKERDPACQVAIGGITQPTPLRLSYLDAILEAYQNQYGEPMPVDVWNVHNFVLREERDSWGVDIPPGMTQDTGMLYEIVDHDNVSIFRKQIVDFRQWMAERGQREKPLIITEYGILMPSDYGFPSQQVEEFMLATFEFFRTATDPALGYPADGNRLVQRWSWFSMADVGYPTGNLLQPGSGIPTSLGEAFAAYAKSSR